MRASQRRVVASPTVKLSTETVKAIQKAKDLWRVFDKARQEYGFKSDDVPDKAVTIYDFMERYGLSYTAARYQLDRMVSTGGLRSGRKIAQSPTGKAVMMRHYWGKGI